MGTTGFSQKKVLYSLVKSNIVDTEIKDEDLKRHKDSVMVIFCKKRRKNIKRKTRLVRRYYEEAVLLAGNI